MNAWLLVGIIPLVLYGGGMLLGLVFQTIEHYQRERPSAAESRRGGTKQAGSRSG